MIDIHCHILPSLDDGATSWDMTLEMCRLAIKDGITHIVATPHADDTYPYSRDHVREVISELDAKIGEQLAFSIGCDFHLSYENIEDAIAHPQRYRVALATGSRIGLYEIRSPLGAGDMGKVSGRQPAGPNRRPPFER